MIDAHGLGRGSNSGIVRGRGMGQPTPEGSTGMQRGGPRTRGGSIRLQRDGLGTRGGPIKLQRGRLGTKGGPIGLQKGKPRTWGGPTGLQRGGPITRSGGRGHIQGTIHPVRLYGPFQSTPSHGNASVSNLFITLFHCSAFYCCMKVNFVKCYTVSGYCQYSTIVWTSPNTVYTISDRC